MIIRAPRCRDCGKVLQVGRMRGRTWPQAIAYERKRQGWGSGDKPRCFDCLHDHRARIGADYQPKGLMP